MDPEEETSLCAHGNPNVLTRDVSTSSFAQGCTGQIRGEGSLDCRCPDLLGDIAALWYGGVEVTMSKLFKGKTCAYCAVSGASDTGDHVLARQFVAVEHRGEIPKVPACAACNGKKAALEAYVTAVLPFGGRHGDALENLTANVPKRLEKNQKLHRMLSAGQSRVWSRERSGLLVNAMALPLDGERLEELVGLIVRGLMFHHWGVALGSDMVVETLSLTKRGEAFFDRYFGMNAKQRAANDICNGALVYEGVQGVDNDAVSLWQLSLYGGVTMAAADGQQLSPKFGVITGPKAIADRAHERVANGKFIMQAI